MLNPLVPVVHPQRRVLPSFELKWPAWIHADHPQIFGEITAFQDSCSIVSDAGTILVFLHHRVARLNEDRGTNLDLSSHSASQHQSFICPGFASAGHHVAPMSSTHGVLVFCLIY